MTLFLKSDRKQLISAIVSAALPKDGSFSASSLLQLGAVYHNRSVSKSSSSFQHEGNDRNQVYKWKRVRIDQTVLPNDDLRVYSVPWRYPVSDIDWTKRILFNEEDFIVIDKPAGIPSHPTTDNFVENVLYLLQDHLGLNQPSPPPSLDDENELICEPPLQLYLPQRLDTDTSGLMVIAKNAKTISYLNKLLQQRRLSKQYKALVAYSIPSSTTLHHDKLLNTFQTGDILDSFLLRSTRSPKQYLWQLDKSLHDTNDFQEASMRLVDIAMPIARSIDDWRCWLDKYEAANVDFGESIQATNGISNLLNSWLLNFSSMDQSSQLFVLQEVTVELLTGRTHQVRGQLQSLQQHPAVTAIGLGDANIHVVGDNLYTGCSSVVGTNVYKSSPHLALQSYSFATKTSKESSKHDSSKEFDSIRTAFDFRLPQTSWTDLLL